VAYFSVTVNEFLEVWKVTENVKKENGEDT
jgi:hypothetical protein